MIFNRINLSLRCAFVAIIIQFVAFGSAFAHAPNENYVWLNIEAEHMYGRFEFNVNDVKKYLSIDVDAINADRIVGVEKSAGEIQSYIDSNFSLQDDRGSPIPLEWLNVGVFDENPDYLQYWFKTEGVPSDNKVTVTNTVFLDSEDPQFNKLHRSVLVIEYNRKLNKEFGSEHSALVFSESRKTSLLDLANPPTVLNWKEFLWQGVLHIWYGLDHVLFIIVLLLTTVLRAGAHGWEPLSGFKPALINTFKIITLFTIAHSITLSLAALQLISVNIIFVESVIALSIIAIALNNLKPVINAHAWLLVFLFGLFHGFGFASVMGDLHFRTVLLERILVMFNVGVELGQLAIVVIVFPILFLLRKSSGYQKYIVVPVSVVSIGIASFWFLQRAGIVAT